MSMPTGVNPRPITCVLNKLGQDVSAFYVCATAALNLEALRSLVSLIKQIWAVTAFCDLVGYAKAVSPHEGSREVMCCFCCTVQIDRSSAALFGL